MIVKTSKKVAARGVDSRARCSCWPAVVTGVGILAALCGCGGSAPVKTPALGARKPAPAQKLTPANPPGKLAPTERKP